MTILVRTPTSPNSRYAGDSAILLRAIPRIERLILSNSSGRACRPEFSESSKAVCSLLLPDLAFDFDIIFHLFDMRLRKFNKFVGLWRNEKAAHGPDSLPRVCFRGVSNEPTYFREFPDALSYSIGRIDAAVPADGPVADGDGRDRLARGLVGKICQHRSNAASGGGELRPEPRLDEHASVSFKSSHPADARRRLDKMLAFRDQGHRK